MVLGESAWRARTVYGNFLGHEAMAARRALAHAEARASFEDLASGVAVRAPCGGLENVVHVGSLHGVGCVAVVHPVGTRCCVGLTGPLLDEARAFYCIRGFLQGAFPSPSCRLTSI